MATQKVGAQFMTGTFANETTLNTVPDQARCRARLRT
jgi:hypothetical protein